MDVKERTWAGAWRRGDHSANSAPDSFLVLYKSTSTFESPVASFTKNL